MTGGRPTRRRFLQVAAGAAVAGFAGCGAEQPPGAEAQVTTTATDARGTDSPVPRIRVPEDQPTIQAGVDAAGAGALVLVAGGTYPESVTVTTPKLTIRGRDRNAVVLEGDYQRRYGVDVEADGVAVENLTARHYTGTGVYWDGVEGFRGSYLTAYTNGGYGIYAARSRDGRFERSYASGHADAGFYLGRHYPFETVVTDVVAERNALGYSGTSAGGDLTIRNSVWLDNGAGIVPHTLDRADPPQRETRIVDNVVLDNDNAAVPFRPHTYAPFGTGIFVWGGNENLVAGNLVSGHENVGIAVQPHVVEPAANVVRGNTVRDSGLADLGLGRPVGDGNRFATNGFSTALPEGIEGNADAGSGRVATRYDRQERRAETGRFPENDWRDAVAPGPQPTMPDPESRPRPAAKTASVGPGSADR